MRNDIPKGEKVKRKIEKKSEFQKNNTCLYLWILSQKKSYISTKNNSTNSCYMLTNNIKLYLHITNQSFNFDLLD